MRFSLTTMLETSYQEDTLDNSTPSSSSRKDAESATAKCLPAWPPVKDGRIRRLLDRDETLTELRQLLSLQFCLWGRDVRNPGGNRLVEFGMQRHPAPGGPGHSRYECAWGPGRVVLWGWGMTILGGSPYAVLLLRSFRVPVLIIPAHAYRTWKQSELPIPVGNSGADVYLAALGRAMGPIMQWIAGYERWVDATTPSVAIPPGHDFPSLTCRSELAPRWEAQATMWCGPGASDASIDNQTQKETCYAFDSDRKALLLPQL